jgi:hypothetical protein
MKKKYGYIALIVVFLLASAACVTKPVSPTIPSSIDNLSSLTKNDSLYVLTFVTDTEVSELIEDLADYLSLSDSSSETLDFNNKAKFNLQNNKTIFNLQEEDNNDDNDIAQVKEFYDGLIDIFDNNSEATNKLKDMVNSSKNLVGMKDLQVEIKGQAKEHVLEGLESLYSLIGPQEATDEINLLTGPIVEPEVLVLDYRDAMYLRLIAGTLYAIYESKDMVTGWFEDIENIYNMDENQLIEYLFKEAAVSQMSEFWQDYGESEDNWTNELFWTDLDELVKGLAEISTPDDQLNTQDLLNEGVLEIEGLGFVIKKLDFIVEIFNQVYIFETDKTNSNGWTDNEKTSLYEYLALCSEASESDDISMKNTLNGSIDLNEEELELELGVNIDELKIGGIDLFNAKWKDLLQKIDSILPNNKLVFSLKVSVEAEESEGISGNADISLTLDFSKLSDEPLDLKNNNLGIKDTMIEDLIDLEIWDLLAQEEIEEDKIEELINAILNDLTFYSSENKTLEIKIDDSIIFKAIIDIEY